MTNPVSLHAKFHFRCCEIATDSPPLRSCAWLDDKPRFIFRKVALITVYNDSSGPEITFISCITSEQSQLILLVTRGAVNALKEVGRKIKQLERGITIKISMSHRLSTVGMSGDLSCQAV